LANKNKSMNNNLYKKLGKIFEYDKNFPDWYWKRGLHDAEIISIDVDYAKLTLSLDSNNAIYERVSKIIFREYKIIHIPKEIKRIWWLSDEIEKRDGTYELKIHIDDGYSNNDTIVIQFQRIEVIRP